MKTYLYRILILGTVFLVQALTLTALPLWVSPDDPVYDFLDKLATRGMIRNFQNDVKPLPRQEIVDALEQAQKAERGLSAADRKILARYLQQFHYETQPRRHEDLTASGSDVWWAGQSVPSVKQSLERAFHYSPDADPPHFVIYERDQDRLWLDWSEALRSESKGSARRWLWRDNFEFNYAFGEKFGLYFDATRLIQTYNPDYSELSSAYRGGYVAKLEEGVNYYSYDFSHAYVNWESGYGQFSLSNYPIKWGNGRESMQLNGSGQAYPAIQWSKRFGSSRFSFIHGWLLPQQSEKDTLFNSANYVKKYIVGHRWEVAPWSRLHLAFSEFIVYGNRDVEMTYMLPMIFLWSAQHNLNDRGNMLMSVDGELFPTDGVKLYGTVFLDELKLSEITKPWWANKQGYQLGVHVAPAGLPGFPDFRLEVTYVHPWIYTHKYDFNTFTHNGQGLGFSEGPNSFSTLFESSLQPTFRSRFLLSCRYLLKGVNPLSPGDPGYYPIGDDPNQNYNQRNPAFDEHTDWIMGTRQNTVETGLSWNYLLTDILNLDAGLSWRRIDKESSFYYHLQLMMKY